MRERLRAALSRGPEAAAAILREQPGVVQSDWIRRQARREPVPAAAAAAVARAYAALSTPARHAAVPLLAAAGGPAEAALVAPHLAALPEVPGFVRLRTPTFQAVVTMWLRGDPAAASIGLAALAADTGLPETLRREAREVAWGLAAAHPRGGR